MLLRQHVFLTFLGHCDAAAVNLVCTKCDLQIGTRTLVLGQRGDVDVSSDLLSIISMSSLTSGSQFSLMARLRKMMLLVVLVKMVIAI